MKRETKKKLSLEKTTIRALSMMSMQRAVGGQTLATCSAICSDRICPDTQFVHGCNSGG